MFDTDYRLVSGIAIIYHQYFSFLTLLMFNSIDFSLAPQALGFAPYIENPAAVHGSSSSSTHLRSAVTISC